MKQTTYLKNAIDQLSVQELLSILLKRKKVAILAFLTVIMITGLYLLVAKPTYESTARVKLPASSSALANANVLSGLSGLSASAMDIELQNRIILSRPVLRNVITKTGLLDRAKKEQKFKKADDLTVDKLIDSIISKKVVSISNQKGSLVLEISYEDKDRMFALKVLTALVNEYINAYAKLNKDENVAQLELLEKEVPKLEKELADIEEKIKKFRVSKSYSPSTEANAYLSMLMSFIGEKDMLEREYNVLKQNLENLKIQIEKLQNKALDKEYTPTSSVLEGYTAKLYELQTLYNTLLIKYTEDHPDLKEIKKQMSEVQKRMDEEIKRIANSQLETPNPVLQNLYSQMFEIQLKLPTQKLKIDLLNKAISDVESMIKALPEIEREFIILQREYVLKQETYSTIVKRYETLKLSAASAEVNKPVVVDPPYVPEKPSKPNKKLALAVGGAFGIFLGAFLAFFAEFLDNKIRTFSDIEKLADVPIIVHVKEDIAQAVKKVLTYTLSNYQDHRKIAIISPDESYSVKTVSQEAAKIFENSGIKFSLIDISQIDSLLLSKTISNTVDEKLKTVDYAIIQIPQIKDNYEGITALKNANGAILAVKLNKSEKQELIKTLLILEKEKIELYGILAL